jgi:hypothetical protein
VTSTTRNSASHRTQLNDHSTVGTENVSQACRVPWVKPVWNHCTRAAAEPWVHCSLLTRPVVYCWMRSSPTALAAAIACWMSVSVRSTRSGSPSAVSVDVAFLAHMPA